MAPKESFRFIPTTTPAVSVKTLFLSTSGVVVIEMVTVPLSPSKLLTEPSCTEFDPSRSLANNVKESMTPSPIVLGMVTVTEPLMVPFTAGNVDQLITLLAGKAITSQQVLQKILVRGLLINLEVKTLTILRSRVSLQIIEQILLLKLSNALEAPDLFPTIYLIGSTTSPEQFPEVDNDSNC